MLDNQAFDLIIENSGGEPRRLAFGQVKSLKLVKQLRAKPVEHGSTLEATAHAIPKGALVEIRFAGKQTPPWLRRRIGQVDGQEFQIQVLRSGMIDVRTLPFAEVESIRPVDSLWVESALRRTRVFDLWDLDSPVRNYLLSKARGDCNTWEAFRVLAAS